MFVLKQIKSIVGKSYGTITVYGLIVMATVLSFPKGIFSQEVIESPTEQPFTGKDNQPAMENTLSVSDLDGPLGKKIDEYYQFRRNRLRNLKYFIPEAKKNGFSATPQETAALANCYNALFPEVTIDKTMIEDETIAANYCRTLLGGAEIPRELINRIYSEIQQSYDRIPPLPDLQPLLTIIVMMHSRNIHEKLIEIKENLERIRVKSFQRISETWPVEKMRINAPANECIAEHKDSTNCILTVKKYNDFVRYQYISKTIPLEMARRQAVENILKDLFLAGIAHEKGFASSDSIEKMKRQWMASTALQLRFKGIGKPVNDWHLLQDAYYRYFDALFSERIYPYFSVIGSSDSVYIDSLFIIAKRLNVRSLSKQIKNREAYQDSLAKLPWSYSNGTELPEEFWKYVDTLQVDSISQVIRTSYGRFFVKLDSIQIRLKKEFEEATSSCIYLASREKWLNLDSLLTEHARTIYTANSYLNRIPDTLLGNVWLTPKGTPLFNALRSKSLASPENDSAIIRTKMALNSTRLPKEIHDALLLHYDSLKNRTGTIGPLSSRFGAWFFEVSQQKHGGSSVPFSHVKKRLIDSLVVNTLDSANNFPQENPDSTLNEIALARSFAPYYFGLENSGDESPDSQKRLENQKMHKIIVESKEEKVDKWFSEVTIHIRQNSSFD